MAAITFSHVGLCVSDIERAARFYCDIFGFSRGGRFASGPEVSHLVGIDPPLAFESFFLSGHGMMIELLQFTEPTCISGGLREMNRTGYTHLSFRVQSIAEVGERIRQHGGAVLDDTRHAFGGGEVIMCTDPDGTRVELMQLPDDVQFA